jgi:hypothetical protein
LQCFKTTYQSNHKENRNAYRVVVQKTEGYHLEGVSTDGRIILEWTLKEDWSGLICLAIRDEMWATVNM